MTLTGIDPFDPTPSDLREIILGVGEGGLNASSRPVLLWGNRTSVGTEPVNVVDKLHPFTNDANARTRLGKRSESYWMYRKYIKHDPDATIYVMCVPESGGAAAYVDFVIAGGASATANSTLDFPILGTIYSVTVTNGDTVKNVVDNSVAYLNDAEDSCLPIVATNVTDTTVRITASLKGPRHGSFLGGAGYGVRASFSTACTLTCTKSAVTAGTTEDDGTTAFLNFVGAEFFYNVVPWITATPLTTDNQTGELLDNIRAQDAPLNGKDQIMVCPWVGTNAAGITAATALNSWLAHMVWQENSEWMPGMLAAAYAAVKRRSEISHPSANFAGWTNTDTTPWDVPPPALVADYPTKVEIKTAINNGFSPVGVTESGKTYIVRDVTTHSENAAGDKDYRARPGHLRSAMAFYWGVVRQSWANQRQPFNDEDPPAGIMPTQATSTPSQVKSILKKEIDNCVSSSPYGIYKGPILAPSAAKWMKDRAVSGHIAAGLTAGAQLKAVQHQYKTEWTLQEAGDSY